MLLSLINKIDSLAKKEKKNRYYFFFLANLWLVSLKIRQFIYVISSREEKVRGEGGGVVKEEKEKDKIGLVVAEN